MEVKFYRMRFMTLVKATREFEAGVPPRRRLAGMGELMGGDGESGKLLDTGGR
jgi:hypothetical protein